MSAACRLPDKETVFTDQADSLRGRAVPCRGLGFTLIEILTVIAAVSVMLSIAMLSLDSAGLRKTDSLTKETSFLMRTLADEAIMTGRRYGLVVDAAQRRLRPISLGGGQGRGGFGFEPIVWDADMQLRLESTDFSGEYEGANFSAAPAAQDEDGEQAKPAAPAVIFEPAGTWSSKANTLVFIYDGKPIKRLTWTALGRVEIEKFVSETD